MTLGVWREAGRGLLRAPRFTLAAILLFAFGVAVITAAFAVVYGILLRPLPYPDANRLVMAINAEVGPADYRDLRARTHVFSRMTFAGLGRALIRAAAGPQPVVTMAVSPNFFSMMGLRPNPGRAFMPGQFQPGQSREAVISYRLAHRLFGRPSLAVGKSVDINGRLRTIVGVAPRRFTFKFAGFARQPVGLWLPLALTPSQTAMPGADVDYSFFSFFLARLAQGVTIRTAQNNLDGAVDDLIAAHPADKTLRGLSLWTLKRLRVRMAGSILWPLFWLSFAFLAIACVNVAGLLLARQLGRDRELAVRAALGASPVRLAALPIAEALWIGAAGAGGGILFSWWAARLFRAASPGGLAAGIALLPRTSGVGVYWEVAVFAVAASLLCALLAGAAPLFLRRTAGPPTALRSRLGSGASRTSPGRPQFGGRALVLTQCAIATLLLAMAGVMLAGIWRLAHLPLGFQPNGVIQARVGWIGPDRAPSAAQRARRLRHLLAVAARVPGVTAAALTGTSYGLVSQCPFRARDTGSATAGVTDCLFASPGYFRALGTPLLAGRAFARQGVSAPLVAVVNEDFARTYLSGPAAVGRSVELQWGRAWYRLRVIGVAANTAMGGAWQPPNSPQIYLDIFQFPASGGLLLARTAPGAYPDPQAFRRALLAVADSRWLVQNTQTMPKAIEQTLGLPRFLGNLLLILAALALLLAFVGVYGVGLVRGRLRAREAAIRRALGAGPGALLTMALRQAAVPGGIGAGCGLIAAAGLQGIMRDWLFGAQPGGWDPLALAALVVVAACVLGALLPALRALRDEPARLLRQE